MSAFSKQPKQPKRSCSQTSHGDRGVTLEDFWAIGPAGVYVFAPCREPWPARSVDLVIGPQQKLNKQGNPVTYNKKPVMISASAWLMQNRRAEQMTWVPGEPLIIRDRVMVGGSWINRPEVSGFNMYRPPLIEHGDPNKTDRWLDLVHFLFPSDEEHILNWFAQRVQDPANKINHALVLGSDDQGIGKDVMMMPVRQAVGPWNCEDISPHELLGNFTGFAKSVILRINEAHDTGPIDRFKFYDRMKKYATYPPEVLRVNEKHMREYYALNCCGLTVTTNNRTDGLFIDEHDRRHAIAWSDRRRSERSAKFWIEHVHWYENEGGYGHVAAYLAQRDLSKFDPKATPPQSAVHREMVAIGAAPEENDVVNAIHKLGAAQAQVPPDADDDTVYKPEALTLRDLVSISPELEWLISPGRRASAPHKLSRQGYAVFPKPGTSRGQWKVNGILQAVYVRRDIPEDAREATVERYRTTRKKRG